MPGAGLKVCVVVCWCCGVLLWWCGGVVVWWYSRGDCGGVVFSNYNTTPGCLFIFVQLWIMARSLYGIEFSLI